MRISLGDIAGRYGCELRGDPDCEVNHVATLHAADKDSITFLANPAYRSQLETTSAAAVILDPNDVEACPTAALVTPNPYVVYARIAADLHPAADLAPGIDASAKVDASCGIPASCQIAPGGVVEDRVVLGERVYIGPNAVIASGTCIGDDTRIMAGVVFYHDVRLGRRCLEPVPWAYVLAHVTPIQPAVKVLLYLHRDRVFWLYFNGPVRNTLPRIHNVVCCDRLRRAGIYTSSTSPAEVFHGRVRYKVSSGDYHSKKEPAPNITP